MKLRHRIWRRRLRLLLLTACAIAMAVPTSAAAQTTDLRSPDAREAARQAESPAVQVEPSLAPPVQRVDQADQTLAIVLASTALGIALVGFAVAISAFFRRPRPRWTAS
jgi:hypothetical protein